MILLDKSRQSITWLLLKQFVLFVFLVGEFSDHH